MRNHNEKVRDMARSVLPSTARKTSRRTRASIHGRERARLRVELHLLRVAGDADDFEGDLVWTARGEIKDMVLDRRGADKVGPLLAWAERLIETDPMLSAATPDEREAHFRKILPPGLIGNHAISHLWRVLDDRRLAGRQARRARVSAPKPDVMLVAEIVAAGLHGDLNGRIRAEVPPIHLKRVRLPAERVVDEAHPPPGLLVPARWAVERHRHSVRLLAGAHDVDAFVKDASWDVIQAVRAFHAETIGQV